MHYKTIPNFLSSDECHALISDGKQVLNSSISRTFHGGRTYIPSSSCQFDELIKTTSWKNLTCKLLGEDFFNFFLEQ